ncbi:MAG: MerR family transcriptional regulator [Acidobacteria bacterium]|nr:MerR family transcriptional regulator [Acidobacteriota bacterium]
MTHPITYPMKAACMLSGLPPDTLRAWERRYKAVVPSRINGRRLYSQEQVERLKLLKWAVDHGHKISRVTKLSNAQIHNLQHQNQPAEPAYEGQVRRIIDLIKNYRPEADVELARMASLMEPRAFVFELVLPIMRLIGKEWEAGKLSIAQEHLTSAAIRNVLGSLVRIYGVHTDAPAIVCATPPSESHEFGALIAAMIASIHGLRAVYLGADLPLEETSRAAHAVHALAVVLSINRLDAQTALEQTATLRDLLPAHTHLIVGGHATTHIPPQNAPAIHVSPTFEVLSQLLVHLKSQTTQRE